MAAAGGYVARVANIADDLSLLREETFRQAVGVTREMRVVVDRPVVGAQLINRDPAARALEQLYDLTCGRRYGRRTATRHNVQRIVRASFGARLVIGVAQLLRAYADYRDCQRVRFKALSTCVFRANSI
jgi:hypothetical protein